MNDAGIIRRILEGGDLRTTRTAFNEILETKIIYVAVITEAFLPFLYKSDDPIVINVSSRLGRRRAGHRCTALARLARLA